MTEYITVDGKPLVIPYTPAQMDVFYEPDHERFTCVPKGRRFGATNGAANFCIEQLIEGKNGLWIDTIQSNLDKYFSRYFLPHLRKIKTEYWRYRTQHKDLRILNGNLDMRSAEKPQNIEGFAYDFIIINEAGIVLKGQKGRDLWYNTVYPMVLDYHADVYFLGTPKGKKAKKDEAPAKTSLYYGLCLKGGLEDPDYNGADNTSTLEVVIEEDTTRDAVDEVLAKRQAAAAAVVDEALVEIHKKEPNWRTLSYTSYDNPLLDPEEIQELEDDVPRVTRAQEIHGKFIDIGDEEMFHEEWFPVVYELPPEHLWVRKAISLDTAFKKGAENDDSAFVCFLETRNAYFWIDTFWKKLEFPELVKLATKFYVKHNPDLCLIEDKASGTPLIQTFRDQFPYPITPIDPKGDKINRAVAVTPYFEQKKVFMLFGAWNDTARDQLCDFNATLDTPDDIVDAVTQYFNYIKKNSIPRAPATTRKRKYKTTILRGYE